ncbi:MAG: hypothetical protein Q8O94_03060 [bacterium]|nr:hypothetical protein [bacterium]
MNKIFEQKYQAILNDLRRAGFAEPQQEYKRFVYHNPANVLDVANDILQREGIPARAFGVSRRESDGTRFLYLAIKGEPKNEKLSARILERLTDEEIETKNLKIEWTER